MDSLFYMVTSINLSVFNNQTQIFYMAGWDEAAGSRTLKLESLEKLIPGYSYSSRDLAYRTDEFFCRTMVANLRVAKNDMFNILNTAFELHRELLLKDFESLRDEIDVFSDEIRARAFKWDSAKSQKWLGRLIDYDYRLLTGLGNLLNGIKSLHKEFLSSKGRLKETKKLDAHTKNLTKILDGLVVMFKERDTVCNIREAGLDDDFGDIKGDIRKSV